jgi:hypothetical protein
MEYAVHGVEYRVPTNGVRASIIDFTLSRLETGAGQVYCTYIYYPPGGLEFRLRVDATD